MGRLGCESFDVSQDRNLWAEEWSDLMHVML
jgi:hypothetical protein